MKHLILHIVLFLGCQMTSVGQYTYKVDNKHVNLSIAYHGLIDLPSDNKKFVNGASISAAYSFINKSREKLQRKTNYNRIVDRDIYIKLNLTTYNRRKLHQTLGVSTGPAFRITIPEGMFFEFDGQVGYLRTFLRGDHFIYEDGVITSVSLLGHNHFSLQGNGIIGWNFQKSNDYPAALFAGVGMMTYFPNNGKWILQPQFQMGLSFVLIRIKNEYRDEAN